MRAPPYYRNITRSELEKQLADARLDLEKARNALHDTEERFRNGEGTVFLEQQYPTKYETESSILSKAMKEFDVYHDPLCNAKLKVRCKFDRMRMLEREVDFRSTTLEGKRESLKIFAYYLDIARIDLYNIKTKWQRVLERATGKLRNYEAKLAAGDESYRAAKDHQEDAIKLDSLRYARSTVWRQARVKRNEEMVEMSKKILRSWQIYFETGSIKLAWGESKMV